MPQPNPGSLEWLADRDPDAVALVDGDDRRTRGTWDERACAVAEGLLREHGVQPGDRVVLAGVRGVAAFEATLALAKLGASPVAVDGDPEAALTLSRARAAITGAAEVDALAAAHAGAPRRLSGVHRAARTVVLSRAPDGTTAAAERTFTPERLATLGAVVADLVARIALVPGGVHLMGRPPSDPDAALCANIALLGGGIVVLGDEADAGGLLAAVDAHGVATALLGDGALAGLLALPADVRERAATHTLDAVVVPAPFPLDRAAEAADLLGEDVLRALWSTPATGVVAVAAAEDAHAGGPRCAGRPLDGVEVRAGEDGILRVRSPATATGGTGPVPDADGWLATGRRGAVSADGLVVFDD